MPPTSERGISSAPEVRLARELTTPDIERIATATGGVLEEPVSWHDWNRPSLKGDWGRISYFGGSTHLDFAILSPKIILSELHRAGVEPIALADSAVIIKEDEVVVVLPADVKGRQNLTPAAYVTISKQEGITYRRTPAEDLPENVRRAASLAYKKRYRRIPESHSANPEGMFAST